MHGKGCGVSWEPKAADGMAFLAPSQPVQASLGTLADTGARLCLTTHPSRVFSQLGTPETQTDQHNRGQPRLAGQRLMSKENTCGFKPLDYTAIGHGYMGLAHPCHGAFRTDVLEGSFDDSSA